MLTPSQIARRGEAIHRYFALAQDSEVTFEIEAKSTSRATVEAALSIGVNRVSFGVQALSDEYRTSMNMTAFGARFSAMRMPTSSSLYNAGQPLSIPSGLSRAPVVRMLPSPLAQRRRA
jgi:hypothetical protein